MSPQDEELAEKLALARKIASQPAPPWAEAVPAPPSPGPGPAPPTAQDAAIGRDRVVVEEEVKEEKIDDHVVKWAEDVDGEEDEAAEVVEEEEEEDTDGWLDRTVHEDEAFMEDVKAADDEKVQRRREVEEAERVSRTRPQLDAEDADDWLHWAAEAEFARADDERAAREAEAARAAAEQQRREEEAAAAAAAAVAAAGNIKKSAIDDELRSMGLL